MISKEQIEASKCKKHKRFMCVECKYGDFTILCFYNEKNKCKLNNQYCNFEIEERWLCEDFAEKDGIDEA